MSRGRFLGNVITMWMSGTRDMQLIADFEYVDPAGSHWLAPAGSVINGASIPERFWSVVGSPYSGPYREASVIHDVFCGLRTRSWRATHWMFYEACLCGGCSVAQAKILYGAVRMFGPRWGIPSDLVASGGVLSQMEDIERFGVMDTDDIEGMTV